MALTVTKDLDFLAAQLHGRRSRLAEGGQLDVLCRIRTVTELARQLVPDRLFSGASEMQWHMVQAVLDELASLAESVSGAGGDYLAWQRVRFQVENLKIVVRGIVNNLEPEALQPHLITLPPDLALDLTPLSVPAGASAFARILQVVPAGPLRDGVQAAAQAFQAEPRPFVIETALDRAYLQTLWQCAARMAGPDREDVLRLTGQEINIFNLMLVVRGWHHYHLQPGFLLPLFVPGGSLDEAQFRGFLLADDLQAGVQAVARPLFGEPPAVCEAPVLEMLAWNRYLHLANTLFRRSHMACGAVIGYAAIRRIELANLVTLAEGLRMGLDPVRLRTRLMPCTTVEALHV
jgi:vacuolar-type H+-ATPase subunit C/Vma6